MRFDGTNYEATKWRALAAGRGGSERITRILLGIAARDSICEPASLMHGYGIVAGRCTVQHSKRRQKFIERDAYAERLRDSLLTELS